MLQKYNIEMATLKEVYDAFKADGAPLPDTYEDFEKYMTSGPDNGYEHRKQWYDAFKADGAPLPDTYEDFSRALFKVEADEKPAQTARATQPSQSAEPAPKPATRYFKLRRGGEDFTVTTDEVNAAGGLGAWVKAHPGAPVRVYMQGKNEDGTDFNGHVDLSVAHDRNKRLGYKYSTYSHPIVNKPQKSWTPTTQQKIAMSHQLHKMQTQANDMLDQSRERTKNVSEYYRDNRDSGFHAVEGKPTYNSRTGKVEKTYLTPTGDRTTDKNLAELEAQEARAQYEFNNRMKAAGLDFTNDIDVNRQMIADRLKENEARLKELYAEREVERYGERAGDTSWDKFVRTFGGAVNRGVTANVPKPKQNLTECDKEIKDLLAENDLLSEAKRTLDAGRDLKQSDGLMGGFFDVKNNAKNITRGLTDVAESADTYLSGVMSLHNAERLDIIKDKVDKGVELTDSELNLVYAAMLNQDASSSVKLPHGYTAGKITGEMLPFMIQMALNPASGLGRALTKKFGTTALKRIAASVAGDVAEAAVLSNSLQAPRTIADIRNRHRGEITEHDGKIGFVGGESLPMAIYKGEASSIIENYTELLGSHFGAIGKGIWRGVDKGARKLGAGKVMDNVSRMVNNIKASDWAKGIANIESRAQWNGTIGEVMEEEAGIVLNSIFTGDNKLSDLVDAEQQIDIVLGVGLFGGFVSGIKTAGYPIARAHANSNLRKKDSEGAQQFSSDKWAAIKEQIDTSEDEALAQTVLSMVKVNGHSQEQQRAIIEYAAALTKARGYNLADASRKQEPQTEADSAQDEVDTAFNEGYEAATPQQMADAQNMFEYQRKRAEDILADQQLLDILDSNPVGALMGMTQTGMYTQEEIDAARDYANAKTVRDGILQRVTDDIDERIAQSDAMINGRVNRETGSILSATMDLDDRQVYIVGGEVVMNPDGTIDYDASDESLVVRDAVTGELEFTAPKSIVKVGEAIDPEAEKANTADNIRQQAAQAAANALNGTLAFNPGDVVRINDGGGLTDVTIVGPVVDEESGMPVESQLTVQFPNDQQTAFTKEQLQAFADAANLERLNQYEQERAAQRAQQRGAAEVEATRPAFALNDEFTILNDDGTPIHGSITGELDEDGMVEIYTEEPINGNKVNRFMPGELEGMFDTYNGAAIATAAPEDSEGGESSTEAAVQNHSSEAEAEQPETALGRIPLGENGKPDFGAVDAETAWDGLVEKYEGNKGRAQGFAANMVKIKEAALKKAEKVKSKPTEDPDEWDAAEQERENAIEQARRELEHWQSVAGVDEKRQAAVRAQQEAERAKAERAEREVAEAEKKRKAALDKRLRDTFEDVKDVPEAVEVLEDMDPRDIYEAAAQLLSGHKVLWGDAGVKVGARSETGFGEEERRRLFGLFASEANGGKSLSRLAEDAMKQQCETYGIPYDNQDARNALIDVISGARTVGDIRNYIANNRIDEARRLAEAKRRHEEEQYDEFCRQEYHLSAEEVEAYEDQLLAELSERDREFDANEYNDYIADEMARAAEITEQQKNGTEDNDTRRGSTPGDRRVQENDTEGKGTVPGRGYEVLPESRADQSSGAAADGDRSGIQPADGVQSDGPASAVAQGASRIGGGGRILQFAERGRQGDISDSQRRQQSDLAPTKTEGLSCEISEEVNEFGKPFVKASDGTTDFGFVDEESGLTPLPIKLSLGENYKDENGDDHGYGYLHIEAGHRDEFLQNGFSSVEEFVESVARNYTDIKEGAKIGKNQTYLLEVSDEHNNTLFIQLSRDGKYWNVNSAGIFKKKYSRRKPKVYSKPAVGSGKGTDTTEVNSGQSKGATAPAGNSSETSDRKDIDFASDKQASGEESLPQLSDNKRKPGLQAAIEAASAEVNTEPTEGQKKAGNYRKGHVQVGTFDVTIEQPVGSERTGKAPDGTRWKTVMNNAYGYIRGTEGVDGDHIDVFLSTDIDAWNGRRVVIVDQYNPDGSFDEHKVMLGFNEKADAINAYLANYEKGWEKGRRLVFSTATLEDFEKWIESSHRKQKPYHEYKIADKAKVDESTPENPVSATDYTIDTYTTKKNKTYHRVVFPRAAKEVWQERLNLAKKMGGTSVPKGYGFKTREEAEAFAKAVADPTAVADAQPLSLEDIRGSIIEEPTTTSSTEAEQSSETETRPEVDKPVNPSGNKLVTDERYAELRERMRKKLGGQLNMGVDPEILAIGTEMAVYHIEKGARKFKAYASAMIADLGDTIRPYLKSFYNAVRDMPEADAAGLVADMDSYDEVRSVDIANFDKPGTDAMATAAAVVAEQEAEKEKEEAEAKLKEKRKKRTNPDGSTTETVVESGMEIEITSGDFIPGVRPTVDAQKSGDKKKPDKEKPKPTTDGGLFDTVEDDTTAVPAITVPEQRPASDLMGDSAAFQEREAQTVELVEEIGGVIESRVAMLQLDAESVKPLTMTDVKKMASKHPALKDISDTDLQELVELAMTQLTRSEALVNVDGTAETQRAAYDHIVNLYQIQPSLNARDSERLIKQQYSTPTPFGYVMGQFVQAGGKKVDSMLEPSAGNGALTITVNPSVVQVNDIDDARLANLRRLGYGKVTAQDALLPFNGEKADVVMTNPPFGTVTEKVYDGIFHISSLEAQMAINALEKMKDNGRAAIVIGGNTSYRTNGSMNPKDAAFFGYLYSHYNVADVINISGKALYSRNGTGYDVRMILIDGRKTGEFKRVFPPVKAKARAEQVTTFEELYKRVQDDIQQIQQVGDQSADVQREPETATDGTASAPIRSGNDRPNSGAGQRPGTTSDAVRDTPRTDSGHLTAQHDGGGAVGVDNAVSGDAGSSDNVPRPKPQQPRSVGGGSAQNGTGRSGSDGRGAASSRPDSGTERLAVKPDLTTEKVPYPNQSGNGFTLMSVVPAAQAQVLQKSLGEIGDVDQYLVDELGYSSKEELYDYLAAEQIDSVALAIHQMNKGNAFIIGDMTGVGKGRQGAALIRYAVKQGKVPIYFTQKPTLFTDNYRDLADIGSSDLRPFIIASNPKDANIVDADGNIVHKLPSKKEQERVFAYIMEHGTLPDEYDYVLTTYDQIKNGTADYAQNEDGTWNTEVRKLPKKSKGYTTADYNGQTRRDALAKLAEGNIAILDESHTVGGDSGCGRYMQMLTSSAGGVTFLSATFAKRADNMPIYAQRTAIAEAEVKASELIDAIMKGGVTLQEIMSKQLVESGQMIRRERSFEGVTIDWLSVEEETNRRQREQFDEVAAIFNAIRNFQDDYITPIIDAKNEAAAEWGATVGHTQGTKDMGVKNVPFASKMYNLVNQLLFALKVDAVADRVVENLRNGYKPVISFTNTMEGFLSSAPKGVAMDEVPNFSLTLMRALDGVMRFTEKDADENTEGGFISLSELSADGQKAYNAIRDKIMNLAADLPISPMDAIRMRIEEAGYSVAEITGRTMQLNRTEDGKYIVEARKDRDKKAAMRDFNSGKLDVLMINKSGSTGISLHASSKFEDQRQRVMVFAQFQSDINDEVQMRGRIDRSGQVTRGRYEYIMSTIPAEQRIQMMFKAKLKSLDANTTSSQKSKFNEMEIVDYLNKYGDDVVWEYMKEHPELEERLGDPLDMLQEKNAEDGPRTSKKEDTSKKTGCAGKISRYLAFLSVDEQDEIFKEITDAYRVKIQLLDYAGENDLEITTMPLRAETKRKQIWHEGVNPGRGNAFTDNTYVEEVEVDVLKKPMKRDEIAETTRKLMGEHYTEKNGGVDWQHYVRAKGDEISLFFQAKADEAVGKLKEAGEARIAKAREKAVTAATKTRGRGENNFTDEQIQSLADTVANEEREKEMYKQRKRQEEIMAVKQRIQSLLNRLHAGGIYVVPQDLKQGTAEMFTQTYGTFVGFKFNKSYTLGSSTAIFATLDGRRKVELALSDPAISTIISATEIAYRYSADEIRAISMDNWDSKVPTQTRQKRYIITGNLLQALVDTEKGEKTRGNLISYSTIDGETRQGILMGENFKPADLRNSAPLSSRLAQIREGKAVVSENGDVQIEKVSFGWQHRGQYELRVPKSKQRGGIYTMHSDLLKLVEGHNFITKGNNMVAYVDDTDIAKVVDMLSRAPFNLTVLQESQLTDVSAEEAEDDVLCRPVTDKATLDRLNSEPTIKVYRAMQMIDGGLRPPMSGKVDGEWREATEVGIWEEAEEHPEMADEKGRFKLDKGNGKSIKAAYNPYIHTSRTPINDQFSSAWSRPELVIVEVEVPLSELTSGYRAEKAKDTVGEKEWKSGPVGRALAKIGQARRVILSRWSRIVRVVPVEEVAEAYAQRLNAHGIEVPFNTVPPALRDALAERGVKIGKPEKGNAGSASLPAFQQWINEQERQRMGDGYGAYTDEEVSYLNDPVSKVMGKNRFSKKRQAEFAARERQRMVARIQELSERMHLDNVEILTDASQLEGKRATAKGFYNKRTGKITIVIPNNVSTIDAEQTLLHEAVAHYGLRQLFGKQFDTFLDNVYQSADKSIRKKIAEMAAQNGWNFRTATEEYLAGLAEDTNFEDARGYASGWWQRVKRLFIDMLERIGFEGFRDKVGVVLTDNELRYILWRSYENLAEPGRFRSILGEAKDVAMQSDLKVGNYAERGIEAEYAAEPSAITELSKRFDEALKQYEERRLPQGFRFELGMPSAYLKSAGFPNLPICMRATLLARKAGDERHPFEASDLKGLVEAIQQPIAIFEYSKPNMRNLIVDVKRGDKHFLVGVTLDYKAGDIEINSVSGLFPKESHEWIKWIQDGKAIRIDQKEKVQTIIDSLRTNPAESERIGLNLDDVTKIVKSFENPTVEEEELFRPGDFSPRDKALARHEYERIVSSGSYQFQEAVQDSMLGLKKLYQAILGPGKRIEDVVGFENAYLFENRMSSMNAGEQHEYFIRYMQPLLKEIGKICGADKRKRKELTDYLMAKHGLERNEYMRNEAAKNGEKTDRDFAGLIGLTGEADWQNAEDTARQWVDDYESMVDTAALWEAINKATKATLEKVYLSGIISKKTYEKILGMYDYYVPLRGWNETTSEQVYGYLTSKDGPLGGSIMKKAEGRESMADDPIATIGMMADDAIRQGNRNLMKQRFLNFILNHPSDAVSVHDIWLEYNDAMDEWVPVFADIEDTDTADEVAQKVEAFEQRMEALRTAEPDRYKKGREAQHIPYKVVRNNLREHQILIKRGGRTFVATINGNPRAAQAINGLTNPDVDQNGVVGNMLKAGTWINRQLSAFYTTRNPDFVVSNFFRDALYSNCMTWVKESPRYALRFHKNFGRLNPVVMRRLLGKWENGTLDMSDKYEKMFYQFMKNGAETGYTNVRDIEGHKRAVAAELKKQGSTGRKAWAALGMQLDLLNRSAENCARFATFVTSREFGRSIDRAIYDAKEISVNFNKKGSGGKMVNANGQTRLGKIGAYLGGGGRLLYVFWNAGIQGMTNFARQAKLHPVKATAGASALMALGYAIPMLAEMLGGGDGDDDDKNAYYNLPEYIRRSNICFYAGEQWVTIPLPIEYRAMYGMGELAYGVISGNERYSGMELGLQMAGQVTQLLPIDMLEGGGGISPFIPSAAKPFTEAYIMNKSWTGLPVYKDTAFNKDDPEWTKAYASADKHLVDFAKWLNEISGGDDYKKGYIDINPAKIEYLLNGTFGGMFTFPNKLNKTGETIFGDREFEWRNIPIANRLIKSGDERTANRKLQNEYFKYLKEYESTRKLMKKYENAADEGVIKYAEKVNFLENSPEYLRHEIFDSFKPDIDADREAIADAERSERATAENQMYADMRQLVNALHDPTAYFKNLYDAGLLDDEYIEWLKSHHGIKLK